MAEQRIKTDHLAELRWKLDAPLDEAIDVLTNLKVEHEANGYTNLMLDIDTREQYGDVSVEVCLSGERIETVAEAEQREANEKAEFERREAYAKAQYEALKAKFG